MPLIKYLFDTWISFPVQSHRDENTKCKTAPAAATSIATIRQLVNGLSPFLVNNGVVSIVDRPCALQVGKKSAALLASPVVQDLIAAITQTIDSEPAISHLRRRFPCLMQEPILLFCLQNAGDCNAASLCKAKKRTMPYVMLVLHWFLVLAIRVSPSASQFLNSICEWRAYEQKTMMVVQRTFTQSSVSVLPRRDTCPTTLVVKDERAFALKRVMGCIERSLCGEDIEKINALHLLWICTVLRTVAFSGNHVVALLALFSNVHLATVCAVCNGDTAHMETVGRAERAFVYAFLRLAEAYQGMSCFEAPEALALQQRKSIELSGRDVTAFDAVVCPHRGKVLNVVIRPTSSKSELQQWGLLDGAIVPALFLQYGTLQCSITCRCGAQGTTKSVGAGSDVNSLLDALKRRVCTVVPAFTVNLFGRILGIGDKLYIGCAVCYRVTEFDGAAVCFACRDQQVVMQHLPPLASPGGAGGDSRVADWVELPQVAEHKSTVRKPRKSKLNQEACEMCNGRRGPQRIVICTDDESLRLCGTCDRVWVPSDGSMAKAYILKGLQEQWKGEFTQNEHVITTKQ